jgi:hypothetical protein
MGPSGRGRPARVPVLTLAIVRVWRVPGLVLAGALVGAVARWLPRPVEVPGRTGGVEWVLTPVLPTLVALAAWASFQAVHHPLERMSARPLHQRQAAILVAALAAGCVAALVGVGWSATAAVMVRNQLLLVGFAAGATVLLPAGVGWIVVALPSAACWLLGAPPPGHEPPAWAVLLQPAGSAPAWVVAGLVAAAGATAYLALGGRTSRSPQRMSGTNA